MVGKLRTLHRAWLRCARHTSPALGSRTRLHAFVHGRSPGEKLFIDYSGNRLGIVDPHTGEIREVELFVATLVASNYTYAEATWTQQLPDWIGSHVRAFNFFGGCVEILVPDNL